MEKEKEDASRITVPITNPSTQDNISRPLYPNFPNYMSSYYGLVPHAWLPPFVPPPSASPYPWSNQQHPWSSTATATSSTTALSSTATLYSSAIPMMGPPPSAYPYPWSNQSILLGAGLISSEDTTSFVWLFKTWLDCMDGKAPNCIITDQDRAMKNTIAIVFPNTRHRYCLWHILQKVPEKLGSHAQYKSGLKSKLLSCIYDSLTIEEFENSWNSLNDTFNLHENAWLQSLYAEREFWVQVYLKNSFWAGMSTTQRSESMNAFFDGYVHARTNLKEFVDQFDNALKKKIENENQADFNSFNFTIPCISHLALEKKFQDVYTNSKFKEVQQEIMGMIYCHCRFEKMDGVIATYSIDDQVKAEDFIKEVTYTLYFNETECEAKCVCGLFKMRGIICRHILAIFSAKKVRELPEKYILDRWRKDIKRKYTIISSSYDVADQRPETVRYKRIFKTFNEVVTNAVSCDGHTEEMISKLYAN